MKKVITIILSVVLLLSISAFFILETPLFYTSEETGDFTIGVNELGNKCFVCTCKFTEVQDEYTIIIPDDYNNIPITQLGGAFGKGAPAPFMVDIADFYMNAPEDSEFDSVYSKTLIESDFKFTIENVLFNISIGKNIKKIERISLDEYYPHINEDETITFYHPVVKINCSEDNEYFYSKDGKLYDKKTDKLIDFPYASKEGIKEFTSEKTFSYDNKYYAVQTVEETEDVSNIIVSVYTTENDEFVASFSPARAMDFWGICWEKDSYNIWIQSSDIGIYCYKFDENNWILDESLELPDYIKTRYDELEM